MTRKKFNGTPHAPYRRPARDYLRRKTGIPCDGCNRSCVFGVDYYMVTDAVWKTEAGLPAVGCLLCIACLSIRLDRPLAREDFVDVPVNAMWLEYFASGEIRPLEECPAWKSYVEKYPAWCAG